MSSNTLILSGHSFPACEYSKYLRLFYNSNNDLRYYSFSQKHPFLQ